MPPPHTSSGPAAPSAQRLPIARMRAWRARRLSAGEKGLARPIFADAIDYARVRIVQLPPLTFGAAVPFGTAIYFSRWRAPADFAAAPLGEQAWFIHEMAHIWQAARGVPLIVAKLAALGRSAYRVRRTHAFDRMNIEAQAETARFLFLARAGASDECDLGADELEACWRPPGPA